MNLCPRRTAVGLATLTLLLLVGCETGYGANPKAPKATVRAYQTQVSDLQGQIDQQHATIAALTPAPPTPTPIPFAGQWQIAVRGATALKPRVGVRDALTPTAAHGVFLVVPITVTNLAASPAYFNPVGAVVVSDSKHRTFGVDPSASSAAAVLDLNLSPAVGPRQPGIAYPDVLVFDVAKDATGFTLEAVDGSFTIRLDR